MDSSTVQTAQSPRTIPNGTHLFLKNDVRPTRVNFAENLIVTKNDQQGFARLKGTVCLDPPGLRRGFSHDEARHRPRGACRRGSPPAPPVRRTRPTEGYRRYPEGGPKPPEDRRRVQEVPEGGPKPPEDRRRVQEVPEGGPKPPKPPKGTGGTRRHPKPPKPPKGTIHAPKVA